MDVIEMKVEDAGKEILCYFFKNIKEVTEMFIYLRDFFPEGAFIIQPLRH
jgi:hypothetical protein